MKALVLKSAVTLSDLAEQVEGALKTRLIERGYQIVRRDLARLEILPCNGDFGCWTVTPGICVQPGSHRDIAREIMESDLVCFLTPVTFGGYSSALKHALDHCIPLISPMFTKVAGETHHVPRYRAFPDLLAIGLVERRDPTGERVFERLVERNALNFYPRRFGSAVLSRDDSGDLPARVTRWLDDLAVARAPRVSAEEPALGSCDNLKQCSPRHALVINGSPRTSESVSAALGAFLSRRLAERGVTVRTERVHALLRADPDARDLARLLSDVDLVILASPLYIDSLPGPVTLFLERIVERRDALAEAPRPRLLAMINCGFPEAAHNDTALAISREFAARAGFDWLGGLAVGGSGVIGGRSLEELGGRVRNLTRALRQTADAVAEGRAVPAEAKRLARKPIVPAWLYRLIANWGFKHEAKKRGTSARLFDRPYDRSGSIQN